MAKIKPIIRRTLYLCDGGPECHVSTGCVHNGGEDCMHTTQPQYAKNKPIVLPNDDPDLYDVYTDNKSFFLYVEKVKEN